MNYRELLQLGQNMTDPYSLGKVLQDKMDEEFVLAMCGGDLDLEIPLGSEVKE